MRLVQYQRAVGYRAPQGVVRTCKKKCGADFYIPHIIDIMGESLVQWVKEGRQPGLSLVVASQQPLALDMGVLSQCDVIISHALTTKEDKTALNRLTKDYMEAELRVFINKIARTGQAAFVDDDVERVTIV